MIVKISRLAHAEGLPDLRQITLGSAGFDVYAANEEDISLSPMARQLIPTGIRLEIPQGHEAQVRPRSGLAIKHGVTVINSPGTIDADYRGEIMVALVNLSEQTYVVKRGERIAQIVFAKHCSPHLILDENLSDTQRGSGGFGSTGV